MCVIYVYFDQMKVKLIVAIETRGHIQGLQSQKYLPSTYLALHGKCVNSCYTVWIFSVHLIILSCAYNTVIITSGGNTYQNYVVLEQSSREPEMRRLRTRALESWLVGGVQGALIWDLHPSIIFLGCLLQATMDSQVQPGLALWKTSFALFPQGHQNFSSTFWSTLYKSSQSKFSEYGPRAFSITIPGKTVEELPSLRCSSA